MDIIEHRATPTPFADDQGSLQLREQISAPSGTTTASQSHLNPPPITIENLPSAFGSIENDPLQRLRLAQLDTPLQRVYYLINETNDLLHRAKDWLKGDVLIKEVSRLRTMVQITRTEWTMSMLMGQLCLTRTLILAHALNTSEGYTRATELTRLALVCDLIMLPDLALSALDESAIFDRLHHRSVIFPELVPPVLRARSHRRETLKLLHIIATPRAKKSNTLQIANVLIERIRQDHPALEVEELNLYKIDLPVTFGDNIEAKYELLSQGQMQELKHKHWSLIEHFIDQFKAADMMVISTPMWNFSIPYALKFYIDTIVQPQYMFRYTPQGTIEPMVHGKKMICVTSRGSDYSAGSPYTAYDFQEPYLRAIFGFIGITDITFINAQPLDITPELREIALASAIEKAREVGAAMEFESM